MQVSVETLLYPSENVLTRKVGDELVLLRMDTEIYFGLDPVGVAMWEAICEAGTIIRAHEALAPLYDVDAAQLLSDLQELTDQLVDKGLMTIRGE